MTDGVASIGTYMLILLPPYAYEVVEVLYSFSFFFQQKIGLGIQKMHIIFRR